MQGIVSKEYLYIAHSIIAHYILLQRLCFAYLGYKTMESTRKLVQLY